MKLTDIRHHRVNDALDTRKDEIMTLLAEIQRKVKNAYYASEAGKGVDWGHVGSLSKVASDLVEINNFLGNDGDDNVNYR